MTDREKVIERLRAATKEMNDRTDRATAEIKAMTDLLTEIGSGVEASVSLDKEQKITWAKTDGAWMIAVFPLNGDGSWTPALRASRKVRIAVAARLDALLEAVAIAAERLVLEIET